MAFPNKYSIGITSLGFQVVWETLASRRDVDVRRLFLDKGDPAHRKCDLFGLSLSWELDGPSLLKMLEKEKIPIWSHERSDKDPLVFGGGPVLTANPEPLAPFFDIILLGDGEVLLPSFIEVVKQQKQSSRSDKLRSLAKVPGIYIPNLYSPQYDDKGKLKSIIPIDSEIPPKIKKQTYTGNKLSQSSVITPEAAWPNIHMVEVVRSCPEMCRFCMASYLTLPFRSNSLEDGLIPAVEKGMKVTQRIGLLGASVTQHPQFDDLTKWLSNDNFENIHLSVSSVRASTVTKELCAILRKRGSRSITMAIESGSQRIRNMINKKLSEEEIMQAVKYAYEGGLNSIKFYGMVGLPSESDSDIDETADLLIKLKQKESSLKFTLGISTFVPKAHTPFQWERVDPEAKKHLRQLTKKLKPKGINVRQESFGWSIIQALISRSDRRLAPIIFHLRNSENTLGAWKRTYKAIYNHEIDKIDDFRINMYKLPSWEEVLFSTWKTSDILPWEHLEGPLEKNTLINHNKLAMKEARVLN